MFGAANPQQEGPWLQWEMQTGKGTGEWEEVWAIDERLGGRM
jgi:hypothetical protein